MADILDTWVGGFDPSALMFVDTSGLDMSWLDIALDDTPFVADLSGTEFLNDFQDVDPDVFFPDPGNAGVAIDGNGSLVDVRTGDQIMSAEDLAAADVAKQEIEQAMGNVPQPGTPGGNPANWDASRLNTPGGWETVKKVFGSVQKLASFFGGGANGLGKALGVLGMGGAGLALSRLIGGDGTNFRMPSLTPTPVTPAQQVLEEVTGSPAGRAEMAKAIGGAITGQASLADYYNQAIARQSGLDAALFPVQADVAMRATQGVQQGLADLNTFTPERRDIAANAIGSLQSVAGGGAAAGAGGARSLADAATDRYLDYVRTGNVPMDPATQAIYDRVLSTVQGGGTVNPELARAFRTEQDRLNNQLQIAGYGGGATLSSPAIYARTMQSESESIRRWMDLQDQIARMYPLVQSARSTTLNDILSGGRYGADQAQTAFSNARTLAGDWDQDVLRRLNAGQSFLNIGQQPIASAGSTFNTLAPMGTLLTRTSPGQQDVQDIRKLETVLSLGSQNSAAANKQSLSDAISRIIGSAGGALTGTGNNAFSFAR